MGAKLIGIVADGASGRTYLAPTKFQEDTALNVIPAWRPTGEVPARLTGGTCVPYGLREWGDLFTARQLVALSTLSDLIGEAIEKCRIDGISAGFGAEFVAVR